MSYKYEPISLKNLDHEPAGFALSFNSQSYHKSSVDGFLSLIYTLMALAILTFKLWDLQNRQHVSFQLLVNKSNDVIPLAINTSNVTLVIYMYNKDESISTKAIKYSQQYQYGINVTVQQYTIFYEMVNESLEQRSMKINQKMVECRHNQYSFCLPLNKNMQYSVFGRADFSNDTKIPQLSYRRYSIFIKKCNTTESSECKQYTQKIFPFIYFYNNAIYQQQPDHFKTVNYSSTKRAFQPSVDYLQQSYFVKQIFFFKKSIVSTSMSLLPDFFDDTSELQTKTFFYDQELREQLIPNSMSNANNNNVLFQAQFRRSIFTNHYRRRYKKIDEMLGQVFGLMALIGAIIFGIYRGYNGWSFQQNIRKYFDLHYIEPNLINYYKFIVKSWLYKFCGCCFKNKIQYTQQVKVQEQLRQLLDFKNYTNYPSYSWLQKQKRKSDQNKNNRRGRFNYTTSLFQTQNNNILSS